MRELRVIAVLGVAALGLLDAGSAKAQATQSVSESVGATAYPTAFIARPINLRAGMIRIDTRFQHMEADFGFGREVANQLAIGGAVGITDSFELGITHAQPQAIDYYDEGAVVATVGPNARRFGDVAVYGRMAVLDSEDFRLSAQISVVFPVHDYSYWQFAFSLPLRARLAERFALDLAPEVRVAFNTTANDSELAVNIPIAGVLNPIPNWWIAGRSGMFWPGFELDSFYFPLLLETGFTVDHAGRALMDISVQGGFPRFITPGANDAVITDLWTLRVNLTGYLAL